MNSVLGRGRIEELLTALGELLAAQGARLGLVIVGGATLSLLGIVARGTSDVDVIARVRRDQLGRIHLEPAEPLPLVLADAVRKVARDYGVDADWLNTVAASQWSQGLPPWMADDLTWRTYGGGLDIALVGRRTLIALKLFAAADAGPGSVHLQDLEVLDPTDLELEQAASWVRTQDVAAEWDSFVAGVVRHVRRNRA